MYNYIIFLYLLKSEGFKLIHVFFLSLYISFIEMYKENLNLDYVIFETFLSSYFQ